MTVYYYEGSPIVAPFTIESNQPVYAEDTASLRQQRLSQDAQRWELSFGVTMNSDEESTLLSTVVGFAGSRTMVMPQLNSVLARTTMSGNLTIPADYAAGVSSFSVQTSAAGSTSLILPRGTFIKFSNHSKIYLLRDDITSNGGLYTGVRTFPTLVSPILSGNTLHYSSSATLSYYMDVSNLRGITYQDGVLVSPGTVRLVEALT